MWKRIDKDDHGELHRARVPGGWLYRYRSLREVVPVSDMDQAMGKSAWEVCAVAMVFVARPPGEQD